MLAAAGASLIVRPGYAGPRPNNLLHLPVPPADGEVMLSEQDRAEFAERGIVWLRGAFGPMRRPGCAAGCGPGQHGWVPPIGATVP